MIIGNSYDADPFHIYKQREEPYCTVAVNWINKESLDDYLEEWEDVEDYILIDGNKNIPYTNDEWHNGLSFSSQEVNLLVECDYCEDKFQLTWGNRRRKAVEYLGNFYKKDKSLKSKNKNIDLYKDHCSECESNKRQETTMIKHGYFHPSHTPEHKEKTLKAFRKHNMVATSRGQRYLAKMFDAELNVIVCGYFADMILDNKVVIEYDGGGHNLSVLTGDRSQKEFDEREKIRSQTLFDEGYKLLRFISPSELFPEDEEYTKRIICEAIAEMYLEDKQEVHITMNSRVNDEVHGKLLPIKTILEKSKWGEELL